MHGMWMARVTSGWDRGRPFAMKDIEVGQSGDIAAYRNAYSYSLRDVERRPVLCMVCGWPHAGILYAIGVL